jgi:hypothetical protein
VVRISPIPHYSLIRDSASPGAADQNQYGCGIRLIPHRYYTDNLGNPPRRPDKD